MKKLFSFAIVALMVGMLLTSCKSKGDQLIAAINDCTEQLEKAEKAEDVQKAGEDFEKALKDLDITEKELGDQDALKEKLEMTDDQVKEVEEAAQKMIEAGMKAASKVGGLGEE